MPPPLCPDCSTPLRMIYNTAELSEWACPVAMEGHRRKLLGPKTKHKAAYVYTAGPIDEETTERLNGGN